MSPLIRFCLDTTLLLDMDVLIAATCLANGQTLATGNPRHFADVPGLVVESY